MSTLLTNGTNLTTNTGAVGGSVFTASDKFLAPTGSSGFMFTDQPTTGWTLAGVSDTRLSVDGVFVLQATPNFFAPQKPFYLPDGSAAAPSLSSYTAGNAGLFFTGSGAIANIAGGGVIVASFSSTFLTVASGLGFKLGNSATTGLVAGALAALTTASLVITDASGQAYRIPCIV